MTEVQPKLLGVEVIADGPVTKAVEYYKGHLGPDQQDSQTILTENGIQGNETIRVVDGVKPIRTFIVYPRTFNHQSPLPPQFRIV